jgi:hypothetical protein
MLSETNEGSSATDEFLEYLHFDLVPEVRQNLETEVEREVLPSEWEVVERGLNIARQRTENRYNQIHRRRLSSNQVSHSRDESIVPRQIQQEQVNEMPRSNDPRLEGSTTPRVNPAVLPVVAEELSPDTVGINNYNQAQGPQTHQMTPSAQSSQEPLDDFMTALNLENILSSDAWNTDVSGLYGQPLEPNLENNAAAFSPLESTADLQNSNITTQETSFDDFNATNLGDWPLYEFETQYPAARTGSNNAELDIVGAEVNDTFSAMNSIPISTQELSSSTSTLARPTVASSSRESPLDRASDQGG